MSLSQSILGSPSRKQYPGEVSTNFSFSASSLSPVLETIGETIIMRMLPAGIGLSKKFAEYAPILSVSLYSNYPKGSKLTQGRAYGV
jgi:hypothetical protein